MSAVEYRPVRIRRVSLDEWATALQPDTPALPWAGACGQRIYSFILVPIPECSTGTTVVFLDALGKTIGIHDDGPMSRMAKALNPVLGELTFLPDEAAED
jgi:hypothetical protein